MDLTADERPSDSPFVQRIWRSRSEYAGLFTSMAEEHWEIVITRIRGRSFLTVRGPETRATPAYVPKDAEHVGIQFKLGTLMPLIPPQTVMDRRDVNLPEAGSQSFWLNGTAWQFPDYENVDTFVDRLARDGMLTHDPIIADVLQGKAVSTSLRTVQRRFLQATGMTHGTLLQIQRARLATNFLKQGVSILDAVDMTGYADQPHMTRALKHLIGQTPAQIISESRTPLSFLFKTLPF